MVPEDLALKFTKTIESCKKSLEIVGKEQELKAKLAMAKLDNALKLNSELKKEMPSFGEMLKAANAITFAIKNGLTLTMHGAMVLRKLGYHRKTKEFLEGVHSLYQLGKIEDKFPNEKDIRTELENLEEKLLSEKKSFEAETMILKIQLKSIEEIKKALEEIQKMGFEPWGKPGYKAKIESIKKNLGALSIRLDNELIELKKESEIVKGALALAEAELKRAGF